MTGKPRYFDSGFPKVSEAHVARERGSAFEALQCFECMPAAMKALSKGCAIPTTESTLYGIWKSAYKHFLRLQVVIEGEILTVFDYIIVCLMDDAWLWSPSKKTVVLSGILT